jgi:hypothetical protein
LNFFLQEFNKVQYGNCCGIRNKPESLDLSQHDLGRDSQS